MQTAFPAQDEHALQEQLTVDKADTVEMHVLRAEQLRPRVIYDKHGAGIETAPVFGLRAVRIPVQSEQASFQTVDVQLSHGSLLPPREELSTGMFLLSDTPSDRNSKYRKVTFTNVQQHRVGRVHVDGLKIQGADKAYRKQQLESIGDERQFLDVLSTAISQANSDHYTTGSQEGVMSNLHTWTQFSIYMGVSPYRWVWFLRSNMSARQLNEEDNLQKYFASYMSLRCSSFKAVEQALSSVKCFHADHLSLIKPATPLLQRFLVILENVMLQKNPTRRQRDTLSATALALIQQHWEQCAQDAQAANNATDTAFYTMLQAVAAAAFTAGFRIMELCPGGEFDPCKYWTRGTLKIFNDLHMGHADIDQRAAVVDPPKRKTLYRSKAANEKASQPFVYELFDSPLCFPKQARKLLERTPMLVGIDEFSTPAFLNTRTNECMDPNTYRAELILAAAAALPSMTEAGLRVSDHIFRKSANVAFISQNVSAEERRSIFARADHLDAGAEYDEVVTDRLLTHTRDIALSVDTDESTLYSLMNRLVPVDFSKAAQAPRTLAQVLQPRRDDSAQATLQQPSSTSAPAAPPAMPSAQQQPTPSSAAAQPAMPAVAQPAVAASPVPAVAVPAMAASPVTPIPSPENTRNIRSFFANSRRKDRQAKASRRVGQN